MFNNNLTVPGFDAADRGDTGELDAARPVLTEAEQAEAEEFDALCRSIAARQAPLDGCEDAPILDTPEYRAHLDALDNALDEATGFPAPPLASVACDVCGAPLYDLDGLARVMCACGAWNSLPMAAPRLRLVHGAAR